jgi:hypothetical protein
MQASLLGSGRSSSIDLVNGLLEKEVTFGTQELQEVSKVGDCTSADKLGEDHMLPLWVSSITARFSPIPGVRLS